MSGTLAWLRGLLGQQDPDAQPRNAADIKRLFRQAARGDAVARRKLGEAYLRGIGVPASPSEAARWLGLAVEAGDNDARVLLATLHLEGLGHGSQDDLFGGGRGKADVPEAARLALEGAEAGQAEAMSLYAFLVGRGVGVPQDLAASAHWYARAAELRLPQAKLGLGLIRLHGSDGHQDKEMACRLMAEAAEAKLPTALYVLGTLYEAAVPPLPFDEARALELYRQAAEANVRPACARLGLALMKGWGGPASPLEGERWLRRAALAGDAEAAAMVGDLQASPPDGSPPNHVEALNWYRLASDNGHARAMRSVGLMYWRGIGTPPSRDDALLWLTRALEAGDSQASAELAPLASEIGNDSDAARDVADRLQAQAEAGDPLAAFNYAVCLHVGVGRARDVGGALLWLRHAGEAGVVNALYWWGRLTLEHGGDAAEAWRWIGEAATLGMVEARDAVSGARAAGVLPAEHGVA